MRDKCNRRFTLLARVEPAIHPYRPRDHLGIDAARAQGERVDVADHFGDGNRPDHAELVGLRHLARDHAKHVRAFVGADVVDAEILVGLVAGGMHEDSIGERLGDLVLLVHIAERRAEDHLVALLRELAEDALGVGGFRNVLDVRGLDLGAELLFDVEPPLIVRIGPAVIANRAQVDESNLERFFGRDTGGKSQRGECAE